MGSGLTNTQGVGQAAIARGRAHVKQRRKSMQAPQTAPSMPSAAWGVKHYARGYFSGLPV